MPVKLTQIDEFLALKRIACVGVTRDPKGLGQMLWQELRQRRYDAVAVNPNTIEIDGKRVYPRVQDIEPPVEGALIMTTPAVAQQVVKDCAAAGIKKVWLYGGASQGAGSPEAIKFCQDNGMDVIYGQCPYMFLPGTPVFHRWHGGWKKLTRSYPTT